MRDKKRGGVERSWTLKQFSPGKVKRLHGESAGAGRVQGGAVAPRRNTKGIRVEKSQGKGLRPLIERLGRRVKGTECL